MLFYVLDRFRKIIIAVDHYSLHHNENGILIVGLYIFLLKNVNIWEIAYKRLALQIYGAKENRGNN